MSLYVVDIHGDIEGDYEIVKKYEEPRKDEVILTKKEYGELVSSEFDNGYAKGFSEALDQNAILDKIRAEILGISSYEGFELGGVKDGYRIAMVNVLNIIDKYKSESEDKE